MSYRDRLAACHRDVVGRKRALVVERNKKQKELEEKRRSDVKGLEDGHRQAVKELWKWFRDEDQMLSEEYANCEEAAQI